MNIPAVTGRTRATTGSAVPEQHPCFQVNPHSMYGDSMSIRLKLGVTLVSLAIAGVALAQTPAVKPSRIRGEVVSLNGDVLQVHRRSGDTVTINVAPTVGISAVKAMQLADINQGSFIGTAATTGTDGKLTATEVVVFPESARGTGEGHYAWDLGPNSSMTNANVD